MKSTASSGENCTADNTVAPTSDERLSSLQQPPSASRRHAPSLEDSDILRSKSLLDNDEDDEDDAADEDVEQGNVTRSDATEFATETTKNDNSERPSVSSNNTRININTLELHQLHNFTNKNTWDGFVRQGTRIKSLLDDAMHKVRDSLSGREKRALDENENHEESPRQRRRLAETENHHAAAELAREKQTQVIQLQRQLKDAQAQASTLKAANATLREETSSSQQQLERIRESLRIAGSNAQKARADADAAEATAATLANSLQSLQTVVTETKRASQVLHQEHQKISAAATSIETKLLQKEGDLARANKELKQLREVNEDLDHSNQRFHDERRRLEKTIENQKEDLQQLQRLSKEREALERARKQRAEKVEQELRDAQALLVEATAGQEQAEQTKTTLKDTVDKLCKANESLHERFTQHQTTSRKDNERLSEALAKAEKESQQLRIDAEASQELIQRLRLDKQAVDKQVVELKNRVATAERRLKEVNGTVMSPDGEHTATVIDATPAPRSSSRPFTLPPLGGSKTAQRGTNIDKENNGTSVPHLSSKAPSGKVCSICFKASFGLMKACQCGNPNCKKRAHSGCVNRIQPGPSVSHPGTPAPALPLVLCQAVTQT